MSAVETAALPRPFPLLARTLQALPPRRTRRRGALAVVVGLVAAAAAAALKLLVPVQGDLALAAAAVLALAVPTARVLSRRILLTGSMLLGLVPLLWWVRLPLGDLGRGGLLLSLLVGGLAAWLVAGRRTMREGARALLPRVTTVDVIPLLAAGVSAVVVSGWFRVRTGSLALTALLPGWDNSAHFDMVHMLLRHGTTVDRLGAAPFGESWQFADYPQGYHALVATLVEVAGVRPTTEPAAALVSYLHAEAWVVVLLGGLLAAAVCSLPALRHRPGVALPAAVLLVAGFVTGPGSTAIAGGFPNFVFACALAACVPLLVAATPRVPMPLHVAAIAALLIGVANAWLLLLAVAAPAAVVLAFPMTRARWRGTRRQWAVTSAVLLGAMLAVLAPLRVISHLSVGDVLVVPGGIAAPEIGATVAVALGGAALCLYGRSARPRGRAWHALTPVVGLLAAAAVGAWQLHTAGTLSYYFYKLLVGVELVSLAVVVVGLAGLVAPSAQARTASPRDARGRRMRRVAAVLAATVAAAQITGFTLTGYRQFRADPGRTESATSILSAAAQQISASRVTLLLPAAPADQVQAQQWFLALTGRWTMQANGDVVQALLTGEGDAATRVGVLLDQRQDAVVVVDPSQLDEARLAAGSEDRQRRVLAW